MGDPAGLRESGNASSGSGLRTWRPDGILLGLIALTIAAGLVLMFVLQADLGEEEEAPILSAGDFLRYEIAGSVNDTAISAEADITIHEATQSASSRSAIPSLSYTLTYRSEFGQIVPNGVEIRPFLEAGEASSSYVIGTRMALTPVGEKCVKEVFYYAYPHVVMAEVGFESSILYGLRVLSPGYALHVELMETNSTGILQADLKWHDVDVVGSARIMNEPWTEIFNIDGVGAVHRWGSIEVEEADWLHYSVTGGSAAVYFFRHADFLWMIEHETFAFNDTLSAPPGNPGGVDMIVEPGTYWFVFEYTFSEIGCTFIWNWD